MGNYLRGLPIATKLIAIIMLSVGVALTLTGSALFLREMSSYRESAEAETRTIAQLVAESSTAALAFRDSRAARETLAALRGEPEILAAAIFTRSGKPFAEYRREGARARLVSGPEPAGSRIEEGRLILFHDIHFDGETLGSLYLVRDMKGFDSRLARYLWIALAVMAVAALMTLAVSSRLQRLVTGPILALADTAGKVTRGNNYEVRAERLSEDEIGLLAGRFNEMMDRIQARDRALQQAQDELEERVALRTAELERQIAERLAIERDLIAAKQMAEESNRAKSAFLANMSHELRTPLNAVIGYSEMLEEDAVERGDSATVADLRRIGTAGKHLLALINDVLDLSKIEAGRMDLRPEWVAVDDVIYEAVTAVGPLAAKNGNTLRVEKLWKGGAFWADGIRFRQSLVNLLSNACKFTSGGEITLELEETAESGSQWLEWRVRDTGIGISAENQTRLFRSFSQVDSTATRRYGGTGLGLAISQRLCELMGGGIAVESEEGKGSTFTIRLPRKEGA